MWGRKYCFGAVEVLHTSVCICTCEEENISNSIIVNTLRMLIHIFLEPCIYYRLILFVPARKKIFSLMVLLLIQMNLISYYNYYLFYIIFYVLLLLCRCDWFRSYFFAVVDGRQFILIYYLFLYYFFLSYLRSDDLKENKYKFEEWWPQRE